MVYEDSEPSEPVEEESGREWPEITYTHTHTHPDRDSIQRCQLAELVGIRNVKSRDPNLTVNNLLARWDHIIPVPFPPDGARV